MQNINDLTTHTHTHTHTHTLPPAGSMFDPIRLTKVFRMRNSGPSPLTLSSVGVGGGGGCEELGFAVTGCDKEVTIRPNKTKKIEIS